MFIIDILINFRTTYVNDQEKQIKCWETLMSTKNMLAIIAEKLNKLNNKFKLKKNYSFKAKLVNFKISLLHFFEIFNSSFGILF